MTLKFTSLFILLFSSFLSFSQLSNGLVAKYYFNNGNTLADVGGIDGIGSNVTLEVDRFGCRNRAYRFDRLLTSFISLGDNFDNIISGPDKQFSISFWFNSEGSDNTDNPMFAKYSTSACGEDQRQFGIELNGDNRISMNLTSTLPYGSTIVVQGSTVINDSAWHHVVLNYDGTLDGNNGADRISFFVDNIDENESLEVNVGNTTFLQDGTAHFGIGGTLSSNGTYCPLIDPFNGLIDDIRIYDRLLTVAEVDSLFQEVINCDDVSVDEFDLDDIYFYPNPARSGIQFSNWERIESVEVLNTSGQVLLRKKFTSNSIDLSDLSAGTYFISIRTKEAIEFTRPLIVN